MLNKQYSLFIAARSHTCGYLRSLWVQFIRIAQVFSFRAISRPQAQECWRASFDVMWFYGAERHSLPSPRLSAD